MTIDRILFPTDFSSCAEGAFRHAAYLADRFGAELHVLHVVEDADAPERDWPDPPGSLDVTLADVCADLGLPLPDQDYGLAETVEVVEEEVVARDTAGAILGYAREEEVDLVVMGTHGRRGFRRAVLGSVAEAVARRAPCPVLTVRPLDAGDGPWPPERVLLAVDAEPGRPVGDLPAAARWAGRLATAYRVPLELLHVVDLSVRAPGGSAVARAHEAEVRESLETLASAIREDTAPELPVTVAVREGDAAEEVRAEAEATASHLLVVGTHGRSGPGRALLGSVAEGTVRTAPCPVLVARDRLSEASARADVGESEAAS